MAEVTYISSIGFVHLDDSVGMWPFDGSSLLSNLAVKAAQVTNPGTRPDAPAVVPSDPLMNSMYASANAVFAALQGAGIPAPASSYALYQAYHETKAFQSPLFKQHNNASGIKFAGQSGAVKGTNGYAWYDSLDSWAHSLKHEITKGSNPSGASSLEDYAARLKKNGYYQDTLDNYIHGMRGARYVLKDLPASARAVGPNQDKQDLDIPGSKDYSKDKFTQWWEARSTTEKVGMGAGAVLVALLVLKH